MGYGGLLAKSTHPMNSCAHSCASSEKSKRLASFAWSLLAAFTAISSRAVGLEAKSVSAMSLSFIRGEPLRCPRGYPNILPVHMRAHTVLLQCFHIPHPVSQQYNRRNQASLAPFLIFRHSLRKNLQTEICRFEQMLSSHVFALVRSRTSTIYRPSAFFKAETRRRDTGIFSSTSAKVNNNVPPATASTSCTMERFTR